MHTSNIHNYTLHDWTLIKMTVAGFVGTGCFLIKHSKGRTI